MSEGLFSKYEREELNKVTAKSILEKLMNIRQSINVEFTARRLIWELIQNAKDNVYLCNRDMNERVDIFIESDEENFTFSHNKGFFTNEQIRGLIRKYSSSDKERDSEDQRTIYKTTGRFGTGFMTTHLLSEIISVKSYYKNERGTFNSFTFELDRQGKNEKEIIAGINKSFDQAESSINESQEIVFFDKELFKTSFIYPLQNKKELVKKAIEETEKGIAYTLINVPEINTVQINQNIYNILRDSQKLEGTSFSIYHLCINGVKSATFLTNELHTTRIIIPIHINDGLYFTDKIDNLIPRFHLDFPMIGTELDLPFIINNPTFEPTEPRDGISLKGDDNEISKINSDILINALLLYNEILEYTTASPYWRNLYNLAQIRNKNQYWIDESWFQKQIIDPTRKKLLTIPIVETYAGGKMSILDENGDALVYFPSHDNAEIRARIWKLSVLLHPGNTPILDHINFWYAILWKDCYRQTLEALTQDIENQNNIEELAETLSKTDEDSISFLNSFYDLLNLENEFIKDIATDKYKVIPNQLGNFTEKSKLFLEQDIDDELKNVCALLTDDPKTYLRNISIKTATEYGDINKSVLKYSLKTQENLIQEINNIIKDGENNNIPIACDYLASLSFIADSNLELLEIRNFIYSYLEKVYPSNFIGRRDIKYVNKKIWEESDKKSLFYIISKISECESIEKTLIEFKFNNKEKFAEWLNPLVEFFEQSEFDSYLNRKKNPILPNQNGLFKIKDDLFLDNGDIDEELKDISYSLGYDFRDLLLEPLIYINLSDERTISIESVSDKISSLIKPMIKDIDQRKKYASTLNTFYLWMNNNRDKARKYFSDLYDYKFLFFTDEEIAENIKKANELDKLMSDYNISDMSELRHRLSLTQDENNTNEGLKKVITEDVLISLGISTKEELDEALKDPEISSRFKHESAHTQEMFVYAHGILERAKNNIISHLKSLQDYDCSDVEETAPTIIAGIYKKGIPIQIVARPSDNGEVIIYYSSEKDTLDCEDSELWVDNNIRKPHIVTLGRVLKTTGIEKIPIELG